MSDLKGKVAVVTGASKGIGAAIAKSVSAAGAAVLGTILATKEAVKHFGPNGGSVINIGSIASGGDYRRKTDRSSSPTPKTC